MSQRTKLLHQPNAGEIVVEWPHASVSDSKKDNDLGPPLAQLLVDLGIKGTENDQAKAGRSSTAFTGSPDSVVIIEAGATAASKGWAAVITALGGGTAVWAAVTDFWNGQAPQTRGALVIGAAVVIAACALGAALIMYGDVRARGQGAAAQYYARAAVASAFINGATDIASKTAGQDSVSSAPAPTTKSAPEQNGTGNRKRAWHSK